MGLPVIENRGVDGVGQGAGIVLAGQYEMYPVNVEDAACVDHRRWRKECSRQAAPAESGKDMFVVVPVTVIEGQDQGVFGQRFTACPRRDHAGEGNRIVVGLDVIELAFEACRLDALDSRPWACCDGPHVMIHDDGQRHAHAVTSGWMS